VKESCIGEGALCVKERCVKERGGSGHLQGSVQGEARISTPSLYYLPLGARSLQDRWGR